MRFPPKFNGGLWTDTYDFREWGPHYWHWNTQETYWPIFAGNHLELHRPYQRMYWAMLPTVERWTRKVWETDGAQYQETIPFNGVMGVWEKQRGIHSHLPVPKHPGYTNLILSSSAEIAMQFWWYYLYSGDQSLLQERAYPLMKRVGTFYLNYLQKDAQGRYYTYPSNAHETYWRIRNPANDLSAVRYTFRSLIQASQLLGVDQKLREVWQDRLQNLVPYPTDPKSGAILAYKPQPGVEVTRHNAENPELFPVGVFPLITLGSPDYQLAVRTFYARNFVNTYGWTTDSICSARLGLAERAPGSAPARQMGLVQLLPLHAQRYQNHPSGLCDYYDRKHPIHPYLEGSGTLATAVGEMLLQSWDGVIRLCPALPSEWDASFKLLAMGGFEITAQAERGKVNWARIHSLLGRQVRIINPFQKTAVVIGDEGIVVEGNSQILKFSTRRGKELPAPAEGCNDGKVPYHRRAE